MGKGKIDFSLFCPEVFQVVAGENYTVYAYLNDGSVRSVDVKPLIKNGGVFSVLEDEKIFRSKLTVLNGSVAWDIAGTRDEYNCIDIDPRSIFNSPIVEDFPFHEENT